MRTKMAGVVAMVIMLSLVLLSCAPQPTAGPTSIPVSPTKAVTATPSGPPTQAPTKPPTQAPTKPAWQEEWDKAVAAAKNEGKVVVYGSRSAEARDATTRGVKEKFNIDVEFLAGRGPDISAKILQERRAGLYLADVYIGGSDTVLTALKPVGVVDPLEPILMLPEVKDPAAWYGRKHLWIDPDKTILGYSMNLAISIVRNTELTRAEEVKSYKQLLDPKWKGKIVLNDPTILGTAIGWFTVCSDLVGMDYMYALAKQEPIINRTERLQAEWIARGKYPLGLAMKREQVDEFRRAGAPIDQVNPEEGAGVTAGSDLVCVVNRAPHPNAARVFINWLLSKEGQTIVSRASGNLSARYDVPTDHVDADSIPDPTKRYIFMASEEFRLRVEGNIPKATEIFGALVTK